MADTAVAITAGAGTNIDTRTEATNSNHRQVIVVGDPSVNAGVAPVDVTTGLVVNISPGVDKGSGTGGSLTQRVIVDSSQLSALGQAAMAASAPVVIASNQTAVPISNTPLTNFGAGEYETVAASQTDQILGATGAVGDYLAGLLITPTTTGAGSVSIKDGNGSSIAIFNTGTLSNLVPFFVPLGMITVNGTTPGWKVTTGANVTVIGIGNFT